MDKEGRFEKITIDLREFGWGIRDVNVIWPEEHDVPPIDSVGTKEIRNDSVEMEDLNQDVKDTMITGEDRVTPEEIENFDI